MKREYILVFLFAISFLIYIPALKVPFFWDDRSLIPGLNLEPEIVGVKEEFRPLRALSFSLDHFLWKDNPSGYHFTNVFLNSLAVILVFYFVNFIFKNDLIAFLASLFFAFHPVHTEAVVWIKNRTEMFCLIFYLLSFLVFFKNYYLSILFFILALLSKETAATFPLILTLYFFLFNKRLISRTLPFWFLAFLRFVITLIYAPKLLGESEETLNFIQHLWIICKTYFFYFYLLIFPKNLCVEWRFKIPENFLSFEFLLPVLTIIVFFFLIYLFRKKKEILFLLLFLLLSLIPQSNIFYIAGRPWAEQRLYLPSISFCVVLVLLICQLKKKFLVYFVSTLILLFYGLRTVTRTYEWQDEERFWRKAISLTPRSARLYLQLGNVYFSMGEYKKAIEEYKKAISLNMGFSQPYYNLGIIMMKKKKYKEAIPFFLEVLRLNPDFSLAYYNLGLCYLKIKEYSLAEKSFLEVLKLKPDNFKVYNNLGVLYKKMGKIEGAMEYFKKAIEISPNYISARYNLAIIYKERGNLKDAVKQLRVLLKLNSQHQLTKALYKELMHE